MVASTKPGGHRMAGNDAIVLHANYEEWKRERALGLVGLNLWDYYTISQFVKVYELDDDEIKYGLTEGGNDGGADGLYFIVNHRLLATDDATIDPKSVTSVHVCIMQIKESDGFKPTEVDKHIEFANDFFDFSKTPDSFGLRYNDAVKRHMRVFKDLYLRASGTFPTVTVEFYYITGADVVPDDYAKDSGERVKEKVRTHLSRATCNYNFIGAEQLWEQVQKRPPKNKILKWSGTPMETNAGFVGLVNLHTLFEFLQDQPGILAERIFESNVRGYQQDTPVNEDIKASLENPSSPVDFWILNNGITMLTSDIGSAGHLALNIGDPQIVNGLQTSREIFNYFTSLSPSLFTPDTEERSVLVRVVKITDPTAQDLVIKATNSQNRMPPASLRMTDQIHRDIEAVFRSYDLYYDRRKGFYKDQGRPIQKIISATALAQAMIAIMLQRPDDARARPGDYFKNTSRYESIFKNSRLPIPVFVRCVGILQRIETYLEEKRIRSGHAKNIKFHMATDLACELTNVNKPWTARLLDAPDPSGVDNSVIDACYARVDAIYNELSLTAESDAVARGPEFSERLLGSIRTRFPNVRTRVRLGVT
jgi:hypothetical protein